jgi:hypothetical protein
LARIRRRPRKPVGVLRRPWEPASTCTQLHVGAATIETSTDAVPSRLLPFVHRGATDGPSPLSYLTRSTGGSWPKHDIYPTLAPDARRCARVQPACRPSSLTSPIRKVDALYLDKDGRHIYTYVFIRSSSAGSLRRHPLSAGSFPWPDPPVGDRRRRLTDVNPHAGQGAPIQVESTTILGNPTILGNRLGKPDRHTQADSNQRDRTIMRAGLLQLDLTELNAQLTRDYGSRGRQTLP